MSWAFAVLVFAASVARFAEALRSLRLVRPLPKEPPGSDLPSLSVVIPARNEEKALEGALRTVLGQEYPALEIVLVDDRSTDSTGRIMQRLAAERENATVVRVETLPAGWLGKNHAVHAGVNHASGEWLLLTDADVRFAPDALSRSVGYARSRGLDHLTMIPGLPLPGYWLQSIVAFFYTAFLIHRGYYRANDPQSNVGIGIGAFNLIRHEAYEKIGGYKALRERPDDDLTLGVRVKRHGLRQRLCLGQEIMEVPWYSSVRELLGGVEKNIFPALGYSVPVTLAYLAALPPLMVGPFMGAVASRSGVRRALHLASAAAQLSTFVLVNRHLGAKALWLAAGYPVCALVFVYAIARSAALALMRGGVYWRGTFYPLSVLRRDDEDLHGPQPG